jgi:hypothetical protein
MRERRRIVDAIAHHPDGLAFELEFLDLVSLVVGQRLGEHPLDADLASNRSPRALIVTGQHEDFDPEHL